MTRPVTALSGILFGTKARIGTLVLGGATTEIAVAFWEKTFGGLFDVLRLSKIKNRLLVFALLATVIPSLTTARLAYVHNRQSLREKVTTELSSVSSNAARQIDLWLKERFYDARVFSNSPEVWENLDIALGTGSGSAQRAESLSRLNDYLTAVLERFDDYGDLSVIDPGGEVVATTGAPREFRLPADWMSRVAIGEDVHGEAYWHDLLERYVIDIARPVRSPDGRFLGALAAEINLASVGDALAGATVGSTGHVYLVHRDGRLLVSSRVDQVAIVDKRLPVSTIDTLLDDSHLEYAGPRLSWVVGTLDEVASSEWMVVAEVDADEAFAAIAELRNRTILVVSVLIASIGLVAYLLALAIVRPLDRLTDAAAMVAEGNLEIDVPVVGHGELGYLTRVFNDMVERLRHSRDELHRISITDELTGLSNRRHLINTLTVEVARYGRNERVFSVLMLDLDHFKAYNDTHGHLAGDKVLARMGEVMRDVSREADHAARYGGEEFVMILPETDLVGATEAAERIRQRLAEETFVGHQKGNLTVSVGVAEFPTHGDTADGIIDAADAALYNAKGAGRNRVVKAAIAGKAAKSS